MKEYKYLHTYCGEDFERNANDLAKQGWKIINVYTELPRLDIILERDIPDKED